MLINGNEVRQAGMAGAFILEPHKHNIPIWQRCHLHTDRQTNQLSSAQTDMQLCCSLPNMQTKSLSSAQRTVEFAVVCIKDR